MTEMIIRTRGPELPGADYRGRDRALSRDRDYGLPDERRAHGGRAAHGPALER